MHEYSTFWIKEEFHYNYFFKPDILCRFLINYISNYDHNGGMQSQFNYITHNIPYNQLVTHIKNYHKYEVEMVINRNKIDLIKDGKTLTLYINNRNLIILSNSQEEVDDLIFQPLKAFNSSFFVIELGTDNSGWITPMKKEMLL
ncbi:sporulation inhibitor of replication protein SirA [Aquibacillus saliphilus]|uniref:sporulation inhibitor of replication protein SirA n=1 Tax=Aquibacillus saliphilus TaxID=1909422 RepID=UPI001CEFE16E|nr:sporulation inhibitor of replication protein SirA [Aquibacillus saliphilus]